MAGAPLKSPMALGIDRRLQNDCAFLYLRGRLDAPFERQLVDEITSLCDRGISRVIVDCGGLDYLSSRGVSVFIAVVDDLREAGGDLKLTSVSPQAMVVLDRLGVSKLIQQFSTTGEAVDAFNTPIEEFMADGGLDVFVSAPGGKVFHKSTCGSATRIATAVTYPSKALARRAGLRACRRCLR